MIKRKNIRVILLISLTILSGCLTILILYHSSFNPVHTKNGFTRKFIYSNLQPISAQRRDVEIRSIAGFDNDQIYFKTKAVWKVVQYDWSLKKRKDLILRIPD